VRNALPGPGRVFVEDFDNTGAFDDTADVAAEPTPAEEVSVIITLNRKTVSVTRTGSETLLDSARRAGLAPPYSCEAGTCGTCIARLTEGTATMLVNEALDDDEVADGYVLTCQAVPNCSAVTVDYE
jgi:ferredoxin